MTSLTHEAIIMIKIVDISNVPQISSFPLLPALPVHRQLLIFLLYVSLHFPQLYINQITQHIFFSFWLISLSVIIFRLIHIFVYIIISVFYILNHI